MSLRKLKLKKVGQLTDSKQVSDLYTVLRPYLILRVKEYMEKSLPPKEETILDVSIIPIQKTYYKAIYEKNTSFLFKDAKPGNHGFHGGTQKVLQSTIPHPWS